MRAPLTRKGPDRFRVRMSSQERDTVTSFVAQLRLLLTSEDPSSDPALARLFPAGVPDDVMANLEYEQRHGHDLLLGKLEALDTVDASIGKDELTEDEVLAWLGSLNAIRLVVGTRLEITEDSTERDFADDERQAGLFEMYRYLTWLEGGIIEALS
ncbi:MAG TPA: DUF2017 family protein [Actinomycetota bacterium]